MSRQEAIEQCLAAADACIVTGSFQSWGILGAETNVVPMAMRAWVACNAHFSGHRGDPIGHLTYLEAASLLRDGWNPGDTVSFMEAA